jgi:hypothetical protein
MANLFAEADALCQAACRDHYGEEVMIEPRQPGGDYSGRQPDNARPAQRAFGVVSADERSMRITGSVIGHGSYGGTKIATEPSTFWMPADGYAALGYTLRNGDAIRCLERDGKPVFTITRPYVSDMGDPAFEIAVEAP